jgi:hypothetical protein
MKSTACILVLLLTVYCLPVYAQRNKDDRKENKDDRKEQQDERKASNQDKVDYNVFRRQILALKEYSDERRKIPALQKASKETVKIVAVVDSMENEDPKKYTGYIRRDVGDNSINVYEIIFDRATKKIISVKPTGEGEDEESATDDKPATKHASPKKKKGDDDDDDE